MTREQTKSQKVPLQTVETCQTKYRINLYWRFYDKHPNVPTGQFLCLQKCNGTQANSHVNTRDQLMPLCQITNSFSSHSPLLQSRSIKQGSKDCWHLVEALGSAIWPHRHCILDRLRLENLQTSDFPLPGCIFSQFFACHMSSVILTDIVQTVLETSEFFLSKSTNNMHILLSGPE